LCFQCYRVGLERRRQLAAALEGSAAPEERFQDIHPFEPVDRERLDRLRRTRLAVRAEEATGLSRFERQRRRAQIEARRALDSDAGPGHVVRRAELGRDDRVVAACVAGDLRMPTAWLPFLMSR
jgi:hypothetical protein